MRERKSPKLKLKVQLDNVPDICGSLEMFDAFGRSAGSSTLTFFRHSEFISCFLSSHLNAVRLEMA